jgi:hypothetical protein
MHAFPASSSNGYALPAVVEQEELCFLTPTLQVFDQLPGNLTICIE